MILQNVYLNYLWLQYMLKIGVNNIYCSEPKVESVYLLFV